VFLGPTLPASAARKILPGAQFYPPVAQGDVWSLLGPGQPEAIAIIDGVFYRDLPVWHKEIIAALERGVAVYGASSIGALRAAECRPFGMVGVGEIFEAYYTGELLDDDEVAVAHDGPEHGWCPRTEPLVNLRATWQLAVSEGRLSASGAERALQVAKAIWFPERSRPALLRALETAEETPGLLGRARSALVEAYVDQKRLDAEALLRRLARRAPGEDTVDIKVAASGVFVGFGERDRKVAHKGVTLRMEEVARHAALHEAGFSQLRERAIDRILVRELATLLRVEVTGELIAEEKRRSRARLQLTKDEDLQAWLDANDVDAAWLAELAEAEALARLLRDWAQFRRGKRLLVKPLLDELRLAGRYEAVVSAAASAAKVAAKLGPPASWRAGHGAGGHEDGLEETEAAARDLARGHIRATAWRPDVPLARFAEEAGFADVGDLLDALALARETRQYTERRLPRRESVLGGGDDRASGATRPSGGDGP
jgi:hypothetical protein